MCAAYSCMLNFVYFNFDQTFLCINDSDEQPIFLRYIFILQEKTKEMPTALQPNQALFSFTIILIR